MKIITTDEDRLLKAADELLYRVLWQPSGFPRNIRDKFPVEGEIITLVALVKEKIAGCIILVYQQGKPLEIRHLAVEEEYRGQNIGKSLVKEALAYAQKNDTNEVYLYGRLTAADFYKKLGFIGREKAEIPEFSQSGVRFIKFTKEI